MRIVLDTNCLLMAISNRNRFHRVWQAFVENKYTPLLILSLPK